MSSNKIFKQFAEKWKLEEGQVVFIHHTIQSYGRKYGKTSRILKSFGVIISPRQLKYFYRKYNLNERLKVDSKGLPKNYRDMSRKEI